MATAAWRDKRIESSHRLIEKAKDKLDKAQAEQEKAEAEVDRLTRLVEWLETMPVEDEAEDEEHETPPEVS